MIEFNYSQGEAIALPAVIVSGKVLEHVTGVVRFINNNCKVFPPIHFEVNEGHFKAFLHVSPGDNHFVAEVFPRARLNEFGFPDQLGKKTDEGSLVLKLIETNNKPIHLVAIVGRDSHAVYDLPSYKVRKGMVALEALAVQRLKVAGRMMQAYTMDEFHRMGWGNRLFSFVEEPQAHQTLFGYDVDSPFPHMEVKVHVLRLPKTVQELRSPDYAQQNPKAKDNGFLFGHAIDLVRQLELYQPYGRNNTPIQCAVMYLDSHWDGRLILTHAALGGGNGEVKMAIFGSHGLHLYPLTFPQISPAFADATPLLKNEVANDANECGTLWECLNICLGAFMHEIGHLLGSPHQTDGVMLRDYIWWNRSFMTRQPECLRDHSKGMVSRGKWPQECHWNIRDLARYLHHDSFTLPEDLRDQHFTKTLSTLKSRAEGSVPTALDVPEGVWVRGKGIYMVELVAEDLARTHTLWLPRILGGPGAQSEVILDYETCKRQINEHHKTDKFSVRVLAEAGDLWIPDFTGKVGLVRGKSGGGAAFQTELLGQRSGAEQEAWFGHVTAVRVYHGRALDGITFYYSDGPPVPPRNYLKTFTNQARGTKEATIGNKTPNYTDFPLEFGEKIAALHFRNGAWIDAVQVETDRGRKSAMLGSADGGHLTLLLPPPGHAFVGATCFLAQWVFGIAMLYE